VIAALATGLILACFAFALFAFGTAVAQRAPGTINFYLALLAEVGLLVQLVIGIVKLAGPAQAVEPGTFVGYLVTSVLILPLAVFWMIAERTKWGAVVLGIAYLVQVVVTYRLFDTWGPISG
jgi:hypothetical protein